jgi:hypothetical protein
LAVDRKSTKKLVCTYTLEKGVKPELIHATEQEKQMIELYGQQHAHWDAEAVEMEIKAAIKSSLQRKVASLEEDKWMFQGEGEGMGKK